MSLKTPVIEPTGLDKACNRSYSEGYAAGYNACVDEMVAKYRVVQPRSRLTLRARQEQTRVK